ncbi:MAG: hypothetical protein ABIR37_01145 [Candidatus Saccharimonadales bacterium]
MALQIDFIAEARESYSPTVPTVSEAFTPADNTLLVVLIAAEVAASATEYMSISGGSLTWTRRVHKSPRSTSTGGASPILGSAEIWTAYATTSPGSITVTFTPNADVYSYVAQVAIFSGSEGSRLTGQLGAVSTPIGGSSFTDITLGGISPGSYVFATAIDIAQAGIPDYGTGQTANWNTTLQRMWQTTSVTAAGDVRMYMTAPANQSINLCAIEIKAARGGGGAGAWLG